MKKLLFATALIMAFSLTSCAAKPTVSDSSVQEASAEETKTQTVDQRSDAIGTWILDQDGDKSEHIFTEKNEVYLGLTLDVTKDFYFDSENNIICNKKTFTKDDYVFENGVFSLSSNGKSLLEMEKTDDSNDLLGEYRLLGGEYFDILNEVEKDGMHLVKDSLIFTASEGNTQLYLKQLLNGFELKENTIVSQDSDGEKKETPYRIEGDTMIVTPREGEEVILTRQK